MIVRFHKHHLAYFRKKARVAYPKEIMAILIGKQVNSGLIEVSRIAYPKIAESKPNFVKLDEQACAELEDDVRQEGMDWVGDIHSHPNYLPVMSRTDHKNHRDSANKICSIVEVTPEGKTRVAIWRDNTPLPCKVSYF
jgi:proteasome lid subunit RPN8/RPN11